MEEQLKYIHFTPSKIDKQSCAKDLSHIEDLAPADSYVDFLICKLADGTYRTVINIRSACGKFCSDASGLSLLNSLQSAKKSILKNLAEWKKWRF